MRLVLFDCDGTLVDSAGFIAACMAASFADFARPDPGLAAVKSVIGLSLDRVIARLAPDAPAGQVAAMTARYKHHFAAMRAAGGIDERLYGGIAETLAGLAARRDLLLGIVTGKSRRGLSAVLAAHGLSAMFVTMRTADDCPSKPHPAMVLECCAEAGVEPDRAVVVGDAVFDMQMAVAAGARAIGVAWGYAPRAALAAAGADLVLDDPLALPAHLDTVRPTGGADVRPHA